jgi:cell wall-associated NlpC family hydrolase
MTHRIRVRRRRPRRRARPPSGGFVLSAVAAGAILTALSAHHSTSSSSPAASRPQSRAAAAAIAYARQQLGKPYLWGGTGPGAFDCSGLVMQAYAAAGVAISRTSKDQWAAGPRVSVPEPGDLVFFAGADGTTSAPGHVGLVTGPHTMIEAYASGYPVRYSQFGTPGSAPGDQDPAGFTDPAGGR